MARGVRLTVEFDPPTKEQLKAYLTQHGFKPQISKYYYNFTHWVHEAHSHTINVVDGSLDNTYTFEDAIKTIAHTEGRPERDIYDEMIAIEEPSKVE